MSDNKSNEKKMNEPKATREQELHAAMVSDLRITFSAHILSKQDKLLWLGSPDEEDQRNATHNRRVMVNRFMQAFSAYGLEIILVSFGNTGPTHKNLAFFVLTKVVDKAKALSRLFELSSSKGFVVNAGDEFHHLTFKYTRNAAKTSVPQFVGKVSAIVEEPNVEDARVVYALQEIVGHFGTATNVFEKRLSETRTSFTLFIVGSKTSAKVNSMAAYIRANPGQVWSIPEDCFTATELTVGVRFVYHLAETDGDIKIDTNSIVSPSQSGPEFVEFRRNVHFTADNARGEQKLPGNSSYKRGDAGGGRPTSAHGVDKQSNWQKKGGSKKDSGKDAAQNSSAGGGGPTSAHGDDKQSNRQKKGGSNRGGGKDASQNSSAGGGGPTSAHGNSKRGGGKDATQSSSSTSSGEKS